MLRFVTDEVGPPHELDARIREVRTALTRLEMYVAERRKVDRVSVFDSTTAVGASMLRDAMAAADATDVRKRCASVTRRWRRARPLRSALLPSRARAARCSPPSQPGHG